MIIVWVIIGIKHYHYSKGRAIAKAMTFAVSTLAVSCPCALGLAVPMVVIVAGGIAARHGVIIKASNCTERARLVTDVVFDKTVTITESSLQVDEEIFLQKDHEEAIGICKALVAGNKHPVAVAVANHLQHREIHAAAVQKIRNVPGYGVEAHYKDSDIALGTRNRQAPKAIAK